MRARSKVSLLKVLQQGSAKNLQPRGQGPAISCFSLNPLNRTKFHKAGLSAAVSGDWHGFIEKDSASVAKDFQPQRGVSK